MATEKYIIDKSDLTALLRGEVLAIQPRGNIRGFCVEIEGNLTNGDIFMATFPDAEVEKIIDATYQLLIGYRTWLGGRPQDFTPEWWNAPYKLESEET